MPSIIKTYLESELVVINRFLEDYASACRDVGITPSFLGASSNVKKGLFQDYEPIPAAKWGRAYSENDIGIVAIDSNRNAETKLVEKGTPSIVGESESFSVEREIISLDEIKNEVFKNTPVGEYAPFTDVLNESKLDYSFYNLKRMLFPRIPKGFTPIDVSCIISNPRLFAEKLQILEDTGHKIIFIDRGVEYVFESIESGKTVFGAEHYAALSLKSEYNSIVFHGHHTCCYPVSESLGTVVITQLSEGFSFRKGGVPSYTFLKDRKTHILYGFVSDDATKVSVKFKDLTPTRRAAYKLIHYINSDMTLEGLKDWAVDESKTALFKDAENCNFQHYFIEFCDPKAIVSYEKFIEYCPVSTWV
jgi:hypothetical protein